MPAIRAVLVNRRQVALDFASPAIGRRHSGREQADAEAAIALHVDFGDLRHVIAGPRLRA
jgi:hypothetical protein